MPAIVLAFFLLVAFKLSLDALVPLALVGATLLVFVLALQAIGTDED